MIKTKKNVRDSLKCCRGRKEPDHCGKVTLTQRHRTDRELSLVNSAVSLQQIWLTPAYHQTNTFNHNEAFPIYI